MKKQAAFLFLPLLFAFNISPLQAIEDQINQLISSSPARHAQLTLGYGTTSSVSGDAGADTNQSDATNTQSDAGENENNSYVSATVGTDTSATEIIKNDATASVAADVAPSASGGIASTLTDLISPSLPSIPGIPNTEPINNTSTTEILPASTSINVTLAPPSTIASTTDTVTSQPLAATGSTESTDTNSPADTTNPATQETTAPSAQSAVTPPDSSPIPPAEDQTSSIPAADQGQPDQPSDTTNAQTIETPTSDIFSTGAVTFRFDDGWQSQIDSAIPVLDAAGVKGTFYIVTHQLLDDGFSGFMSSDEVKGLAASGEEVGAHTRTHPHLPTLSTDQQQAEIAGAKSDLQDMGLVAQTFSYPYGEYTPETTQIVKDSGFLSAVSTIETPVSPDSDRFQIPSPSIQLSQSPAEIESMIDTAVANHQWLVMTFHRIDNSGDPYSITPENFQEVVNYVKDHQIPTVTVTQGVAQLQN